MAMCELAVLLKCKNRDIQAWIEKDREGLAFVIRGTEQEVEETVSAMRRAIEDYYKGKKQ